MVVRKGWEGGTDLKHDLGDLDGVGRGACAADAGAREGLGTGDGVGDVGLVVGRVKVLAIPAAAASCKYLCSDTKMAFE